MSSSDWLIIIRTYNLRDLTSIIVGRLYIRLLGGRVLHNCLYVPFRTLLHFFVLNTWPHIRIRDYTELVILLGILVEC